MQLSLSGFLFEDGYASQSISLAEFCEVARSAGYAGVELRRTQVRPDMHPRERAAVIRVVKGTGLSVTCLTARGLPNEGVARDEFFVRYLDLCGEMDCRLLKIGGDTAWLRDACATAEDHGVVLASNNHVGGPLETVAGTKRYLREISHRNMRLLYDPLHLNVSGEDYLGCIAELACVTGNILVHSLRPPGPGERPEWEHRGKGWVRALPDEPGVQNWRGICAAFKAAGYDGLVTVIENGWPPERRVAVATRCAEAMQRFWDGA